MFIFVHLIFAEKLFGEGPFKLCIVGTVKIE